MVDDTEVKFFDENGDENEFTKEGEDLEDIRKKGQSFENCYDSFFKKLKIKYPDVRFIDIDE
jgi:hypothetical protein